MALTYNKNRNKQTSVYVRPLTISDFDRVLELEHAAMAEQERCSPAIIRYRLTVCPELCHGLFTLSKPHPDTPKGASGFKPQEILVAQIIATKTAAGIVTDGSMKLPEALKARFDTQPTQTSTEPTQDAQDSTDTTTEMSKEQSSEQDSKETSSKTSEAATETGPSVDTSSHAKDEDEGPLGHDEFGDTICIHTLCVAEQYRRSGFATILMRDYMARMRDAGCSKRIALLTHSDLATMYTKLGFRNKGDSKVTACGGNWLDFVYVLGVTGKKGR